MATLSNFINGQPVLARSGESIPNINPATGEQIAAIPRSSAEDVSAAVAAADAARAGPWGDMLPAARADMLDKIADALEARLEAFAQAESRDNGKPLWLARKVDIPRAVANFRFFAGAVRHDETGSQMTGTAINYTVRKPMGVVGLITPWNLPLYLLTWKTAPALAMGNTIVAKPSEMTPTTATMLAALMSEVGLPDGVFNVVHGLGPEAGAPLVRHPDVSAVSFTGGTATGRIVARDAAPMFKKLSLELGGKNASIVFDDCDFDRTVDGVLRAAFLNQGQICLCGSRILVQQGIYERFVEALTQKARALQVGPPQEPDSFLGALISEAHRDKVEGYLTLAREEGGTVLCGGERPDLPGAFLTPAVVAGLAPTARAASEEIFGPVVTVHPFSDAAEAVDTANQVRYGLAASVWTRDLQQAHRVSAALDTGMVWVNCWLLRDLRVPFGGVKDSGVGREGGRHSLEFFSESQNICIQLG